MARVLPLRCFYIITERCFPTYKLRVIIVDCDMEYRIPVSHDVSIALTFSDAMFRR